MYIKKSDMKIIYRISDKGFNKVKPDYINNENCLQNALKTFPLNEHNWFIIADSVSNNTKDMIEKLIPKELISYVNVGHGAGTFNLALDKALTYNDEDIIYFIENDYLHLKNSSKILQEGFDLGADYMTLYLHPDKFIPPSNGGNPEVDEDGGYSTKLYKGESKLFFITNSTTMTFASKVKTLKEDENIIRYFTTGIYPKDYEMFLKLRDINRVLLCPVSSLSTHGENLWLAPFINWKVLN